MTDARLIQELSFLNAKIDMLRTEVKSLLGVLSTPVKLLDNERAVLLKLSSPLVKTYFALQTLGKATATEVSQLTGKCRAVESMYLNQLAIMGFCAKGRSDGNRHNVVFSYGGGEISR